jgi:murein DD-endopeptidase MepM/ murein hydrolase activator NlpD
MNRWLTALTLLSALTLSSAAQRPRHTTHKPAPEQGVKNILWQPSDLQQGSPAFFTVEFDRAPSRVTATWIGKTLSFFKTGDPKVWYALAGADLDTQPGAYDLVVSATIPGGRPARATREIPINTGNFKTGNVDVPENMVEPDEAGRRQLALDDAAKARAFAHLTPTPLWSGSFILPVKAPPTDSFGEARILNEKKSSTHRGTDFPVNEGTPIIASNSGTVVLAKELFYEGNCIIIDHGERLFTIYMHLSKIDVAAGDNVEKGARLGLSGKTGRVTGPHVHIGVRWNGAYLDPVKLTALTLPQTHEPTPKPTPHKRTPTHRR